MMDSNDPIFPIVMEYHVQAPGLSIKAHFAALAMQGLLAQGIGDNWSVEGMKEYIGLPAEVDYSPTLHAPKFIAKRSLAYADALLAALKEGE